MSFFVFMKGPKSKTNRIWAALTLSTAIYGFCAYMASISEDPKMAFFWWQAAYYGIILIPVFFLHFTCSFLNIKNSLLIKITYGITFALWILNLLRPDIFLGEVTLFFTDSKIFKAGYWVYPPSLFLYFFIVFFQFIIGAIYKTI